jgi:membrane-associated phospholipid phosphatase
VTWWPSPWYEVADEIAATALCALLGLRLWIVVDHRSRTAESIRRMLGRRGATNVFWAAVALCALVVAAEGALDRDPGEFLVHADAAARHGGLILATTKPIRRAAFWMSQLSGIGLVSAVGSVTTCFLVLRCRREGLIVLFGSLTAWILSGVLKLAFGVPRPRSLNGGFPSGHVMVTVVAFGLVAWCLGRFAIPATRRGLYVAAGVIALLTGAARIISDAHWLSDVIGGLAAGTLWLNLVILVASTRPDENTGGLAAFGRTDHDVRPGPAATAQSLTASATPTHSRP